MWELAGLIRTGDGLSQLTEQLELWSDDGRAEKGREAVELDGLVTLGRLVAAAATLRTESRGGHYRSDFPARDPAWRHQTILVTSQPRVIRPEAGLRETRTAAVRGARAAGPRSGGET